VTKSVPLVDLTAAQAEIAQDLAADIDRVLSTASFVGGADVADFEREYAEFVGVRHCVGVANGTDALELALRAVGVGPGEEVVLPANTFIATAEAVVRAGATPVLVDVDPRTLLVDPDRLPAALTPRTRAILPVHLFGQLAPVEDVLRAVDGRDIVVIEDAAQSQGAMRWGVGSGAVGRLAATSFYPGKNLGAAGDAGAVTTDDDALSARVRLLGNHGSRQKYVHDEVGFNSRLDAIQAVVLRHKLRRLPQWNALRRQAARRYAEMLGDIEKIVLPATAEGNEHVWHLYVVRVPDRDGVVSQLNARGIGAGIHYPVPLHLTGAFSPLGFGRGSFPVSEAAADEILSLPIYPHITVDQQERVVTALLEALGR
jgi:dTDP-4-amino-4,6-dideoxygalactose transaminase